MVGFTTSAYAGGLMLMSLIAAFLGKIFRVGTQRPGGMGATNAHGSQCTRILLATSLAAMLAAVLTFFFVESLTGVLVGRFLEGMAGAGIWTFALAFLADNVDPAKAGTLSGLAFAGTSVGPGPRTYIAFISTR